MSTDGGGSATPRMEGRVGVESATMDSPVASILEGAQTRYLSHNLEALSFSNTCVKNPTIPSEVVALTLIFVPGFLGEAR